jgi:cytoskeletal protein RodZ
MPVIASVPEPLVMPAPAPVPQASTAKFESPVYDYVPPPEHRRHPDEMGFTTGTAAARQPVKTEKRPSLTIPIAVVLVAVIGGGLLLVRQRFKSSSTAAAPAAATTSAANSVPATPQPPSSGYPLASKSSPLPSTSNTTTPAPNAPQPKVNAAAEPPVLPTPAVPAPSAPARPNVVAAAATGSLAVNSSISAEIYFGDKYLGSTPTTLQLPSGNQTIEYRHGDLRTVVTHVIKAGETTTANITFDAVVQVNARPWAQVYVDGTQRVLLGQTPLSNIKLPIGTVLVFENPNFPSKSHKIAAEDKTIQMVFQ